MDGPHVLARSLGRFDLAMLVVGATIGSGIFLTPSSIAAALPAPSWILAAWGIAAIVTLAGALTFAELGVTLPGAGGVYAFLARAYGPLPGFLFGWAYFLVVTTGAIAALCVAFARYVGWFLPLGAWGSKLVALGALALVTALNVSGVRVVALFTDVFTVLKIAAIAGIVVFGLALGGAPVDLSAPLPASTPILPGIAVAAVGVLWSYGGWQHVTFAAAEAKNPRRDLPLAIVAGMCCVAVVYLLANVAYLRLLPASAMAESKQLASDALASKLGRAGGVAVAAAVAVSTLGTAAIYTMTAPRMYWAMAKDGLFFRSAAVLHPRFGTPARAILLQSAWAAVLLLFWGTFESLIAYVVFTDWIFFGLAGASVFVLRRRIAREAGAYRTPGFPITPAVFVLASAWIVVHTLVTQPAQAIAGLAFIVAGVPVFFLWRGPKR